MDRNKKSVALLPFPVIAAAAGGDTEAMCAVLKHYEGYIAVGQRIEGDTNSKLFFRHLSH